MARLQGEDGRGLAGYPCDVKVRIMLSMLHDW